MNQLDPSEKADWIRGIFEEFESPLLRFACHLTGDLESARDIVQDIFLKICEEPPVAQQSYLAQWLFTVCRNRALDVLRKESRLVPWPDPEKEFTSSHSDSPADHLAQLEQRGQLLDLLASLPPGQQEVVRLKFQHGLSYREISQITRLSVSNVGFLLHTALKQLRHQWRRQLDPPASPLRSYENQA